LKAVESVGEWSWMEETMEEREVISLKAVENVVEWAWMEEMPTGMLMLI
jgi:hypothetical protein